MLAIHYAVIALQVHLIAFHMFQLNKERRIWKINIGIIAILIIGDLWRYNVFGYHITNQSDTWLYILFTTMIGAYTTGSLKGFALVLAIYFLNALISMITAITLFNFLLIDIEVALRNPFLSILGQLSGFALLLPSVFFVKITGIKIHFHLISKKELTFWAIGTLIFGYYVFNFLIMWSSYHQTFKGKIFGLAGVIGGLIGVLGGLAYLIKSSESKMIKRKSLMQTATISQQLEHYTAVRTKDEETRNFRHDIKKQLLAIYGNVASGQTQEATKQISKLIGDFQEIRERAGITTGSDSIDANLYFLKKEYSSVNCEWDGQLPQNIIINNEETVSLIGNLLENAFEAADKVIENKYVSIKINRVDDSLFFQIKNSYNNKLRKIGNHFLTTKTDKRNHGLGLLIVEDIVAKYDGEISFDVKGQEFIVEVSFLNIVSI